MTNTTETAEFHKTKALLEDYMKMKVYLDMFETESQGATEKQKQLLKSYQVSVDLIEKAVGVISAVDEYESKIIRFRYFQGNTYKATALKFCGIYSERSVERKRKCAIARISDLFMEWGVFDLLASIREGIEAAANGKFQIACEND